ARGDGPAAGRGRRWGVGPGWPCPLADKHGMLKQPAPQHAPSRGSPGAAFCGGRTGRHSCGGVTWPVRTCDDMVTDGKSLDEEHGVQRGDRYDIEERNAVPDGK